LFSGYVLDKEFLHSLAQLDIIYSWNILRHTGNQVLASSKVDKYVNSDRILFMALYNFQKACK